MLNGKMNSGTGRQFVEQEIGGWMLFARLLVWATRNNHRA